MDAAHTLLLATIVVLICDRSSLLTSIDVASSHPSSCHCPGGTDGDGVAAARCPRAFAKPETPLCPEPKPCRQCPGTHQAAEPAKHQASPCPTLANHEATAAGTRVSFMITAHQSVHACIHPLSH